MGALDIVRLIVTPAMGLVVQFLPRVPAPVSYEVVAGNGTNTFSGSTTGTIARVPDCLLRDDLTVAVTAHYLNPGDDITGASMDVTTECDASYAEVIRQRMWDILFDAELSLDDRDATLLHDGFYRPKVATNTPLAALYPVIEVGQPLPKGNGPHTSITTIKTYEIQIRLLDSIQNEDQALARLGYLADKVAQAIDLVPYLNLAALGVRWRGEWRRDDELTRFRDNFRGLRMIYVITVNAINGRMPLD